MAEKFNYDYQDYVTRRVDGNNIPAVPNMAAGGQPDSGQTSINEAATSTGNVYVTNVGGADSVGLIQFTVTAIGYNFFQNELPAGWRILLADNRSVIIDNQGAGVGNFAVVQPGIANRVAFPYIYVNDSTTGTMPISITINPNSGGETDNSNNASTANVQVNAVDWYIQSVDGTTNLINDSNAGTNHASSVASPHATSGTTGFNFLTLTMTTFPVGVPNDYAVTSWSFVGAVDGISPLPPSNPGGTRSQTLSINYDTLAPGTYLCFYTIFLTRTSGGSEHGQITIPIEITKP